MAKNLYKLDIIQITPNINPSSFCWNRKNTFLLFFFILSCLAILDICVLEYIVKPMHRAYKIPWKEFTSPLFLGGKEIPLMHWHYAFIPVAILLFGMLGIVSKNYKIFLCGAMLMMAGWEDTLYYVFQMQMIPSELPWLDPSPYLYYLSRIFGHSHVSAQGLILGNFISFLVAWIWLKSLNKTDSTSR
jgi:hypothetical protein